MAKKGKGRGLFFFGTLGIALSLIPIMGKVKSVLKKAKKKRKKKRKKKKGKVFTKARKLKNILSKVRLVKKFKRVVKKAYLAAKKVARKVASGKASSKAKQAAVKASKQIAKETVVKTKPKTENPFVKTYNSVKEIGKDFMNGVETRRKKALDSPYDFANYLTMGALDGTMSGAKTRYEKMWDSPSDFLNYASFGMTGMVEGAVNPKDPLSKEHLLDSFGVVTSVFGVKGSTSKTPSGGQTKPAPNPAPKPAPKPAAPKKPPTTGGQKVTVATASKKPKPIETVQPKVAYKEPPKKPNSQVNSLPKAVGETGSSKYIPPTSKTSKSEVSSKPPAKSEKLTGAGKETKGTGEVGGWFPTRQIDPDAEGHIIQRVSELKTRLSNGALNKSGSNFAYAEMDVPGIKKEFYAHSQVDGPPPPHQTNMNYDGFSFKPQGEVRYPAEDAPNSIGKLIPRNGDTEHKIINDLANQLGEPNSNIKGKIKLFTENDTCASCNKNIRDFKKDYPNIIIEIIHNNGNKIPKK